MNLTWQKNFDPRSRQPLRERLRLSVIEFQTWKRTQARKDCGPTHKQESKRMSLKIIALILSRIGMTVALSSPSDAYQASYAERKSYLRDGIQSIPKWLS